MFLNTMICSEKLCKQTKNSSVNNMRSSLNRIMPCASKYEPWLGRWGQSLQHICSRGACWFPSLPYICYTPEIEQNLWGTFWKMGCQKACKLDFTARKTLLFLRKNKQTTRSSECIFLIISLFWYTEHYFTHQILQRIAHQFLLQSFYQSHLNRLGVILRLTVGAEPLRQNRTILRKR